MNAGLFIQYVHNMDENMWLHPPVLYCCIHGGLCMSSLNVNNDPALHVQPIFFTGALNKT